MQWVFVGAGAECFHLTGFHQSGSVAGMSKPPLESRLEYYCLSCLRTGPRSESYHELKKQTPGFTDTCAYCQSDDVEVFDPKVSMHSELVN